MGSWRRQASGLVTHPGIPRSPPAARIAPLSCRSGVIYLSARALPHTGLQGIKCQRCDRFAADCCRYHLNASTKMHLDKLASIPYIKDDALYQQQKAYAIAFTMEGISEEDHSNHKIDNRQIVVHDLRGLSFTPQLESSGFQLVQSKLAHTIEDLEASDYVEEKYFPDIARLVMATFPQYSKVIYSDHVVSTCHHLQSIHISLS
jgi:hypothetical protein